MRRATFVVRVCPRCGNPVCSENQAEKIFNKKDGKKEKFEEREESRVEYMASLPAHEDVFRLNNGKDKDVT